ncbi:putative serine/threonine-protein kinase [Iris pallida]|uniref:Serine/threonine-protein kinase n=1 Tax=Iris pallida TaxID=29817 RepID=A0AAX6GV48_IRIPA|nr:putative serine/threonine-protein kinase [Iris pallida]
MELQKNLPDGPISAVNLRPYTAKHDEGAANKSNQITLRIRPPRSSSEPILNISPRSQISQKTGVGVAAPVGAFWSTHHAQDNNTAKHGNNASIQKSCQKTPSSNLTQTPQTEGKTSTRNESTTFVADFDASGLSSGNTNRSTSGKEQTDVEINSLKEQLKQANSEKAEITMKCEKLTAICRSQQQEIQVLKLALAEATPSSQNSKDNLSSQISPGIAKTTPSSQNSKDSSRGLNSPGNTLAILPPQPTKDVTKSQISPVSTPSINPPREKIEKGIWELEQAMLASSFASASPAPNQWQAFDEEPKVQTVSSSLVSPANNGQQNSTRPATAGPPPANSWAFGQNGDALSMPADYQAGNTSQRYGNSEARRVETNQTTGWVGF